MLNRLRLALIVLLFVPSAFAADQAKASRTIGFNVSVPSALRLQVDVPTAGLTIENGPPGRISVAATVEREFGSFEERESTQQIVDATSLKIELQGSRAFLRRQLGEPARGRHARATETTFREVHLTIPAGMHVVVRQTAGELTLKGDFGDIDISLKAGEVNLAVPKSSVRELTANVRVGETKTNLGEQVIEKEGLFAGRTHYVNQAGRTTITIAVTAGEVNIELTP